MGKQIHTALKLGVVIGSLVPMMLSAQKKNVLFIAIDDLKPVLNCYGESQIYSPNIDQLASKGVVFEKAYCQWSVCGPSRASLLSGMTPDGSGVRNLSTQLRDAVPNVVTLPQFFKNNGYISAAYGKIFDRRNVDDGHDAISWSNTYVDPGKYTYPDKYESFVKGQYRVTANTATECGPEGVAFDGYQDGQIYLDALSKLNAFAQDPNQPFFLAVGFKKPHIPFIAPKEYWDLYDRESIELSSFQKHAENSPDFAYYKPEPLGYNDIPEVWTYNDIEKGNGILNPDDQRRLIHGYYACVSYIDDMVGRLIARLEETGLAENTIIVLWGDHGYQLGDHNQWGKHTNLENAVQTPLIISIPDGVADRSNETVDLSDIYPTVVDLAGFEVPDYLQGQVLSPIVENKSIVKSCAVSEFRNGGHASYSFRTSDYRMTIWNNGSGDRPDKIPWSVDNIYEIELYDYANDPLETVNLIDNSAYQNVKDSLLLIAANWWFQQHWFFEEGFNPSYTADFNYILNNPGFEDGIADSWKLETLNGFNANFSNSTLSSEGTNALLIDPISVSQNQGDAYLESPIYDCFNGLKNDKAVLSFQAKAQTSGDIIQVLIKTKSFIGAEENILSNPISLASVFNKIEYEIQLKESVAFWQVLVLFGKITDAIWLDDFKLLTNQADITNDITSLEETVLFHPNPVSQYVYLNNQSKEYENINLYTLQGQLLKSFDRDSNKLFVDDVKNGTYILALESQKKKHTQKIIIRH